MMGELFREIWGQAMKGVSGQEDAPWKLVNEAGIQPPAQSCVHSGKDKRSFHHSWFLVKIIYNRRIIKD